MHTVRLLGSNRIYRVGKVICIARNYRNHIAELGNPPPVEPVFFLKPASSIIGQGEPAVIPHYGRFCHHEVELALLIGKWGKNIPARKAPAYVAGYGVAIDLTLRDVQDRLKTAGLPWDKAKGFDTSCPLSDFIPADRINDPHNLQIRLWVNDQLRQDDRTDSMMLGVAGIVSAASTIFSLEEGDIVLTGTPAGVGPVVRGDRVRAEIENVGRLEIRIEQEADPGDL
ncbi:MAG: fumarylacetoacetate hydrolase family protein [Syntrophotaleaceae bacterium]